jgi:uncharacterized protein (TIGR02996 family)
MVVRPQEARMIDDAAFLAAIKAAPNDDMPRLVYADWLDEQGRPGGDFLRVDCQIAALDPSEFEQREQLRAKLRAEGVVNEFTLDTWDSYFWQRTHLVAKLRVASRGLEDDWMAAVSRVSIEEISARVREIERWLRRRITVAELLTRMAEWDKPAPAPRSLWARVRALFRRPPAIDPAPQPEGPHVRAMREWVEGNLRPGDELWEYDTGGESWEQLCGEMGYAIVRKGKVVEFEMLMMN